MTLYRRAALPGSVAAGRAEGRADQGLSAVLERGGLIAWIGPDADAPADDGDEVIDLGGALVLPAFVDAHVHVTETGLLLTGLDLIASRSVTQILDQVARAARERPGEQILGHGWDELLLHEGRAPTAAELDRASGDAEVYLTRVDVHSAVVSSRLAQTVGIRDLLGWEDTGRVERDAHHAVRHATRFDISPDRRAALQEKVLAAAAAAGLGELHEMSGPHIAADDDLATLMRLAGRPGLPTVVPYRGELAGDEKDARRIAGSLGLPVGAPLAGLAGDLMVDGSIGSHTACLGHDYSDASGARGHLYLSVEEIRDHVAACTRAGLQAGFHVIGDGAVSAALAGFEAAAHEVGVETLRRAGHRLEHVEALDAAGIAQMARLGVSASVQPAFDAAWGGPEGMYARRLGPARAARLNPFAAMTAAGIPLLFGSDSPVTPLTPWATIRAALTHRTQEHRLTMEQSLANSLPPATPSRDHARTHTHAQPLPRDHARTHGHPGLITVGGRATFAVWEVGRALEEGAPSTPGSLIERLGERLREGAPAPTAAMTVIDGVVAHRA